MASHGHVQIHAAKSTTCSLCCRAKVKEVIDKMRKQMRMEGWEKFKKRHVQQEAKEEKGASGQ